MRPLALALLTLVAVLLPQLAHATTVAVLPLEKAAAGTEYDGLGSALAGMLVSDLAGAEGLTLVERERLDALLAEIELGKSGFVDPKTAARLGKGAGAEVVLLGSYSVVGDTLALDARLVEVSSSRILDGATASGTIADFVSVEKELAEGLIGELDATLDSRARRSFYTNVPTEDWEAFAAYARGQARASEGELEAARQAFEEALAKDPAFVAAAEGLARLQALVAETRAANTASRKNRYSTAEDALLADVPDIRSRKKDDPWTLDQLTDFALRVHVLHNHSRHCDRYAEMLHYLELVDWDPEAHEASLTPNTAFGYSLSKRAEERNIEKWASDVWHPEDEAIHQSIGMREGRLWRDAREFVFDELWKLQDRRDDGLLTSLVACYPDATQARAFAAVREGLVEHDLGGREDEDELTALEVLTLVQAWGDAQDGVISAQNEAAMTALLSSYPDIESPQHKRVLRDIDGITRDADKADKRRAGLLGLPEETIRSRLEAIEAGEAPFTRKGAAWCGPGWDNQFGKRARELREDWDEELEDHDSRRFVLPRSAVLVRTVGDMGCLKGVKPRYTSWEDAVATLKTASAQRHPTQYDDARCKSLEETMTSLLGSPIPPAAHGSMTYTVSGSYLQLVQSRCLVETP